jgi:hypothetical protein
VDDRNAVIIIHDTDFQRLSVRGRSNEHRDVGIIGLESSPVVSECVEHVVIGDTVLAGARFDVHRSRR